MALGGLDPFNLKRQIERANDLADAASVAADLGFLRTARRALLPLPVIDREQGIDTNVFPPFRRRPARELQDRRVAIVGSGGSGATVSLIGVARAFEEAGVEPSSISVCSGSALWGTMWAAGLSAQEMADFALSWRPEDYLDIQWTRLPRLALSALRGFTGLAKGEALQRLFDRRLWHMAASETPIPLQTVVWNVDTSRVEYFGSRHTPELTLGELVRIACALPLFVEAVRVNDHLYVDGGVVDAFPVEPLLEDEEFDHVFGLNVFLPPGLQGEDISGWDERRLGVARASRQLRYASHLELARQGARRLGDRLTLIEPVGYEELHGVAFYDLFLDRRKWPRLMLQGYEAARQALAPFGRRGKARRPAGAVT